MARILLDTITETIQTTGTTFTLLLPPDASYAVDDILMGFITNQNGATTISVNTGTGWNVVTGQTQATNSRSVVVWKRATSTSEADPIFNVASSGCEGLCVAVTDVDTTTAVETSNLVSGASVSTLAQAASVDSVSDNVLAFYYTGTNESTTHKRFHGDIVPLNADADKFALAGTRRHLLGYKQLGATGAQDVVTARWAATTNGQLWTIYLKNASGGSLMPYASHGLNQLAWFGSHGSSYQTITNAAPSNFAGGIDINSIPVSTAAPTMSGGFAPTWGYYTNYTSTENFASPPASKWIGNYVAFTFPDLTGEVLSFEWYAAQDVTAAQLGTQGHIFALTDGTNILSYQISPKQTGGWPTAGWVRVTIELGVTTPYWEDVADAVDLTAVTGMLFASHRNAATGATIEVRYRNLFLLNKAIIIGGGGATPASWEHAYLALSAYGNQYLATKQGSSQYLFACGVQVGDGTKKTIFSPSPQALEMTPAYNATTQKWWRVAADKFGITLKTSADDDVDLGATGLVTTQSATLSFDAASSATAVTDFQSLLSVGYKVTWSVAESLTGVTFKSGNTVTLAAATTWTSFNVLATTSTTAAMSVTANACTLTMGTIEATAATAYHLSLGASVTAITLNGVTLTGTPGTDKIYSALASGTLTITTDGLGTALVAGDVTFIGGSTAVAVIAAPQVYQKVTVSGITTGARVQIYDTTSSTELFNGTATAGDTVVSGSTVVWTDPAAASANRAIRVRVSYVSGVTAKNFIETSGLTCGQTAGTAEITYPVSPTDDTVYNANGENGSTIYGAGEISFVDASPDRIEMNMTADTISLKEQYAAWVYYVFTSAGIASDIDYINAIDTANYEYTGIRWKNTSSPTAPLKITGGYAWDSSTLDPMTLIDTSGGTIFLAPAHVVAYQTSGTYAITGDISTVLAAIPSDTDNAAAVLAAAVDGSTTVAESFRLANSVLGGKVSGAGTGTETFRDLADTKDRVVSTVDVDGNRTAVTRTLT